VDCGIFASRFAEYLSRDIAFDFKKEHMAAFRRRTLFELMQVELTPIDA